jgi:hypothetical protein
MIGVPGRLHGGNRNNDGCSSVDQRSAEPIGQEWKAWQLENGSRRALIGGDGGLVRGIDGCDVRRQPERQALVIRASSNTYSVVIAQQVTRERSSRAIGHHGPMNGEHGKNEHARVDDRHLFRIVAWLEQASPPHWRGWVWHIDPDARVVLKQSPFDGIEAAFDIIRDRLGAKPPPPRDDDG